MRLVEGLLDGMSPYTAIEGKKWACKLFEECKCETTVVVGRSTGEKGHHGMLSKDTVDVTGTS